MTLRIFLEMLKDLDMIILSYGVGDLMLMHMI